MTTIIDTLTTAKELYELGYESAVALAENDTAVAGPKIWKAEGIMREITAALPVANAQHAVVEAARTDKVAYDRMIDVSSWPHATARERDDARKASGEARHALWSALVVLDALEKVEA